MSYQYSNFTEWLASDEGVNSLSITRNIIQHHRALAISEVIDIYAKRIGVCDSWQILACIDRMIELGEARIAPWTEDRMTQHQMVISQ